MPVLKLNKRNVDRIAAPDPSGKQVLYLDTDLKGFGVLASGVSSTKTYIVQRRLKDGRLRRLTIGPVNVFDPEKAREIAQVRLGEMLMGKDPKARTRATSQITLRAALAAYLEARVALRDSTRRNYHKTVERQLCDWLDRPILQITSEMVHARHREVQREVAAREKERLQKRTDEPRIAVTGHASANSLMRGLRAVWNFTYERARRTDPDLPSLLNPVGTLKLERAWFPSPRRETLVRADQLPVFYEAACGLSNRIGSDYIKLLLFTGLRRSEATALRWEDVDFSGRVIRLPAARTKNGSRLDLPMTDFVGDLLVARRSLGRDGPFVFPGSGARGCLQEPKGFFREIAAACGVTASPHDLRRTFITVAADVAISPMALKALVNHALGGDVTEGYARLSIEQLRRPAQMVCERMVELCKVALPAGINVASIGRM